MNLSRFFSHAGIQTKPGPTRDSGTPLLDPLLLGVSDENGDRVLEVRANCLAIYVGLERKRYEVPVKYLSFPAIRDMIKRSIGGDDRAEIKIDGPIILPCTPTYFDRLLKMAEENDDVDRNYSCTSLIPAFLSRFWT